MSEVLIFSHCGISWCSHDRLDCVQESQGVLRSQEYQYYLQWKNFGRHWREKALFAVQLVGLVIATTGLWRDAEEDIYGLIICSHKMLNVVSLLLYILLTMWWLGYNTYHHPGAGVNGTVFPRRALLVEAVGSLRFEAADPNAMPGTGSISLDGSLSTGPLL